MAYCINSSSSALPCSLFCALSALLFSALLNSNILYSSRRYSALLTLTLLDCALPSCTVSKLPLAKARSRLYDVFFLSFYPFGSVSGNICGCYFCGCFLKFGTLRSRAQILGGAFRLPRHLPAFYHPASGAGEGAFYLKACDWMRWDLTTPMCTMFSYA